MIYKSRLAAKVAAVNAAHAEARRIHPILRQVFEPHLGKKIVERDGTLISTITLPELPNTPSLRVYQKLSNYSLGFQVTAITQYEHHACGTDAMYYDVLIPVCELHEGVLAQMSKAGTWRSDFTIEEIQAAQQRYDQLQAEARQVMYAISPFTYED